MCMAVRQKTFVVLLALLLSLITTGVQAQCTGTGILKISTAAPCAMHCCGHEHSTQHQRKPSGSLQTCEVSLPAAVLSVMDDGAVLTAGVPASLLALETLAVPAKAPSSGALSASVPPLIGLPLRI